LQEKGGVSFPEWRQRDHQLYQEAEAEAQNVPTPEWRKRHLPLYQKVEVEAKKRLHINNQSNFFITSITLHRKTKDEDAKKEEKQVASDSGETDDKEVDDETESAEEKGETDDE